MSTGPRATTHKTGGSFTTMLLGTAFFVGVFGTFYYSRFAAHRKDDQTWIARRAQQHPGHMHNGSRIVSTNDGEVESSDDGGRRIPLPGNDDNRGSEGAKAGLMSAAAGRGANPDGKVPKEPGNIPQPAPQRRNEDGSQYTKVLGNYAEGYKERPKDPEEGRS
ncbi:uncharacterized protein PHACADRAFT_88807 [Phanerochaete carnosa HHB-10118-sp]|uniref:Uncharacterized protein n=1 Tax=Phanerochaete carnosa (strain HHB-10118-sp) TaxID=650164 RepID=K5W2F9_PHACS|nr:uncharacterized protein PHACADRAFT_88807 [Phanerochaete carnosa HHB-10118-sp]EKM58048.1 hypothetical protein PHACADRAFT_88807 [Phanerochaete carnosa HHB-10118-sp]